MEQVSSSKNKLWEKTYNVDLKNDWNINIMFLPFTAIFGEVLSVDPISSVEVGITVFLELTTEGKIFWMHKMCSRINKSSKCNFIRVF